MKLDNTPAGRQAYLDYLLLGPEVVDENGEPTGERIPLIDRETYLLLLNTEVLP